MTESEIYKNASHKINKILEEVIGPLIEKNSELEQEVHDLETSLHELQEENDKLKDENEKLKTAKPERTSPLTIINDGTGLSGIKHDH